MNGSAVYYTMPSAVDIGSSWTLMGWADRGTTGTAALFGGLSGGNDGLSIFLNMDDNKVECRTDVPGSNTSAWASATINDQNWHHYGIVCTEGVISFYVDGVFKTAGASGTESGYETNIAFRIGIDLNDVYKMYGRVDDCRIYLSALTGTQVSWIEANPGLELP